jgi:DNA-binding GntR family transcriptional regulator
MAARRATKASTKVPPPGKGAPARASGEDPGEHDTAAAQGLDARLRRDIVDCELAPGRRLKFEELRSRYDAGMGSLREALIQLESEGLVIAEANRGFCVAPVSISELEDVTALRVDIEKKALRQSIENGTDEWETGILAALHLLAKLEPEIARNPSRHRIRWDERHRRFHDALVAACPSPWLLRFRQVLFVQGQRYRALSMRQSRKPGRVADHRALMELALARDVPRATAAMEAHIRKTAENVRAWLAIHGKGIAQAGFSPERKPRPRTGTGSLVD